LEQELLAKYLDKLDEMLPLFIRRLHQELADSMDNGVTANQFMVMKMINDHGQMTVSDVAEGLSVSLSAVTSQVDRLHRVGVVERRRLEDDRRVVWLELTDEGRKIVETCQAGRLRVIQRYLGQLDDKELKLMIEVYEKIISIMRQDEQR